VLLRKAFQHELPSQVQRRGKQGFGMPVGAWFRGPLADWAGDLLRERGSVLHSWFEPAVLDQLLSEHREGTSDHGKRLWALVVLALWAESAGASSGS
jgi:asparagine synthase (glutamine-hydrolysing)